MGRRRADGKKAPRHKAKKDRLRELIPRIGFDLADKRCRATLSGVDSVTIKEQIRAFAGDLNKPIVDEALASIFEQAIAAMEEDADKITEMMPGEYWGIIKQTLPWTSDALAGHTIFSLVVALLVSHEAYDAANPYDKFKHQYGKLASAVHQFSGLLKQHHQHNTLIMGFYFESAMSLPSDEEEDEEEEEEKDEEEEKEGEKEEEEMEVEMEVEKEEEKEEKAEEGEKEEGDGDVEMADYQGEAEAEAEAATVLTLRFRET